MVDECENDQSFRKDNLIEHLKFKVKHLYDAFKQLKADRGKETDSLHEKIALIEQENDYLKLEIKGCHSVVK